MIDAGRPATFGFHLCRGNQLSRWLVAGGYDAIAGPVFCGSPLRRRVGPARAKYPARVADELGALQTAPGYNDVTGLGALGYLSAPPARPRPDRRRTSSAGLTSW